MQVLTNIGLESGFYITKPVSNNNKNYRPVALQDTSLHNTGYSEQNQFLTNFIKTKFQPGFKPKFKLEFKPKFKPETRARASHDEPARSSFDSEPKASAW